MASVSKIRQNFHEASEKAINDQINLELTASYVYQSMAFYFDRDDVALPGFSKFYAHNSEEEREHAEKLMKYMNKRGGRIVFKDVKRPERDEWGSGLESLEAALDLEKKVNDSLLKVHAIASENNDAHLADFLESEYLEEQVHAIKELGEMISKLKRAGNGLGEYLFDKELHSKDN
ncbi:ferritin [Brachionus plicatilis]|uniref:Ferritin n=1 Tax=Brachionus plicatilis TaxID=10195 RepID=A0A3M7RTT7_BRAPC|nr:ferritin [Brachionus plicatilis]